MTTIRAAVLEGVGGDLEVQELDLAPPRAGEVQVRLLASGVCHSDLNAVDGTSETRCPAVLGHEGAGVVEAVGPGATMPVGTRVALSWMPSCGRCDRCRRAKSARPLVRHPEFGEGEVVARRGTVLTVFFPQFGDKTLREDFVQPVARDGRRLQRLLGFLLKL